jgi:hypothetical protein
MSIKQRLIAFMWVTLVLYGVWLVGMNMLIGGVS